MMEIEKLLNNFRDHLTARGRSPHTVEAYVRDARLFGEWFRLTNGRAVTPGAVTPIDVRQYRSYLLTIKSYKPATVNRKLSSLSALCRWAREQDMIEANPVEEISQVEEVRPAPKWLDKRGQYALLRAVQEGGRARDVALVTLMLNTGLRISEVSNLKVNDVEMSPRKGRLTVRGGKGGKHRRVPLNADVRNALADYLEERAEVDDGQPLFLGQRGGALQPPGIYYLIKRYAYDARLEEVTPHTLRHTFGKNLVDAGVSLDRVAQLLGHESVDTTRIYTTPSEQDLQREVEKVAIA
jgi:integrase/recombinase XerC